MPDQAGVMHAQTIGTQTQKTRRGAGRGELGLEGGLEGGQSFFAAFARAYFAAWWQRFAQYRARSSDAVNPHLGRV